MVIRRDEKRKNVNNIRRREKFNIKNDIIAQKLRHDIYNKRPNTSDWGRTKT